MRSNIPIPDKKQFFTKSFPHLWRLEETIGSMRKYPSLQLLELSVLGKVSDQCISSDKKVLASKNDLKTYWKGSLGPNTYLGLFCNPEIGSMFIAGPLVSQFLNDLEGKVLAEVSSGPYGILRGLGLSNKEVSGFLKDLNKEHFLLLVRGYSYQLDVLTKLLKNFETAT